MVLELMERNMRHSEKKSRRTGFWPQLCAGLLRKKGNYPWWRWSQVWTLLQRVCLSHSPLEALLEWRTLSLIQVFGRGVDT